LDRSPSAQWLTTAAVNFGNWSSREQADFNGSNELLFVAERNPAGSFGIKPLQDGVQVAGAMFARRNAQPVSQLLRPRRRIRQAFEQRAQIQSRSDGKDQQFSAL